MMERRSELSLPPGRRFTGACNGIQHIPSRRLPYPDGSQWLHRNSPAHLTQESAVGDLDHRFSVGYPSFKKEGGVSWAENTRPALPGANCDLYKSAPVARDRYKESRR